MHVRDHTPKLCCYTGRHLRYTPWPKITTQDQGIWKGGCWLLTSLANLIDTDIARYLNPPLEACKELPQQFDVLC